MEPKIRAFAELTVCSVEGSSKESIRSKQIELPRSLVDHLTTSCLNQCRSFRSPGTTFKCYSQEMQRRNRKITHTIGIFSFLWRNLKPFHNPQLTLVPPSGCVAWIDETVRFCFKLLAEKLTCHSDFKRWVVLESFWWHVRRCLQFIIIRPCSLWESKILFRSR